MTRSQCLRAFQCVISARQSVNCAQNMIFLADKHVREVVKVDGMSQNPKQVTKVRSLSMTTASVEVPETNRQPKVLTKSRTGEESPGRG